MSLLVLEDASLSFGQRKLLDAVSIRFGDAERTGLVGPNGSGKTTLLRILAGQQSVDTGRLIRARSTRIGYLPQDIAELPGETVLAAVLATVPGRADIEARLTDAEHEIATAEDPDEQMALATNIAELHEELDYFEVFYSERRAVQILTGLGFRADELGRSCSELSGGWKMRVALGGLLFQAPDLLLLDEPTNHLDAPSVAWLDGFLGSYTKSLLLICHDRAFLNRHVDRIVSFEPEGVRSYPGDYEDYLSQRALEEEILEARAKNQERELRDLQRFVDKFRAKATKARQAQSRAKQIKKIEKELVKPIVRPKRLSFRFPDVPRGGRDALRLDKIAKRFGEFQLYRDVSLQVPAGERVAILGVNGAGKTTLLRIMAGELAPDEGQVVVGANVERGYYAQHHTDVLDPKRTVLEEVWRALPTSSQTFVRSVCGAFLFPGDDVDKPIGVLSGGERARVLLARLLVKPGNLLLLDEPTNHLDLGASEALVDALEGYGGTLVFVSHNESFVNRLATRVWDVGDGRVTEYPGNLDTYLEHLERRAAELAAEQAASQPEVATRVGKTGPTPVKAPQHPKQKGDSGIVSGKVPSKEHRRSSGSPATGAGTGTGTKRPSTAAVLPPLAMADATNKAARGVDTVQQVDGRRASLSSAVQQVDGRREGGLRGNAQIAPSPAPPPPPARPDPEREKLQERIAELRATESELSRSLADPDIYRDAARFDSLLAEHRKAQQKLAELEARLASGTSQPKRRRGH